MAAKAKATMKAVKTLMKKVQTGFLATTDGRRPALRPMSAYTWVGGEVWLATGTASAKVADVRKRRAVELCFMNKGYLHVRIAGTCTLSTKPADKKKVFSAYPWMKDYFGSPEAKDWAVMRIRPRSIRLMGADMQYRQVPLA